MAEVFDKITAAVSSQNALIVTIKVKSNIPGIIYVIYSNKKAGKFISTTTGKFQTKNVVQLARLRASTTYKYQVILVGSDGKSYTSDRRYFTTDPLPDKIVQSLNFTLQGQFSKNHLTVLCVNGIVSPKDFFQGYIAVDFAGEVVWYYQSPENQTPSAGDFFQLDSGDFLITYGHTLGTPVTEANIYQAAQMQIINGLGDVLYRQPLVCMSNNIPTKCGIIANFDWIFKGYGHQCKYKLDFHFFFK